jgi:hypothetical protein
MSSNDYEEITMKKDISGGRFKVNATLQIVFCLLIAVVLFYGCEEKKEKGIETKGNSPCDVLDKMPVDVGKTFDINYGNKVKLLGITVNQSPNKPLTISYYWQLVDDLGPYDQVFVHFTAAGGKILFQGDHPFCQSRSSSELRGRVIRETQYIVPSPDSLGKEVDMKIGLFAPTTPKYDRLKVESATGATAADDNTDAVVEKLHL